MDNFDSLVVSLLDSDALKGCFKKELSEALHIPVTSIDDVWLQTDLIDNIATQTIHVSFNNVEIRRDYLMDLDFKSIYENTIIFEVGDIIL